MRGFPSYRPHLICTLAAVALASGASTEAQADEFELRDKTVVRGVLLGAGPTRVLVEIAGEPRFLARKDVIAYRDSSGRGVTMPESRSDPSGLVVKVKGPVRVRRGTEEREATIHGLSAALFEGDELRTGPYGTVHVLLPGGGSASAWGDAVVRLRDAAAELVAGTLRLHDPNGRIYGRVPGGRIEVAKGKLEAVHLRGRTRLRCLGGSARLIGTVGFRLDLPKNHTVDLTPETSAAPATLAASNTNAWALRLEVGTRRVSIQRGERVLLLGAPSATPPPPSEPLPAPREEPLPAPSDLVRVISADASFALLREGSPARRVPPTEAEGMKLEAGDRIQTEAGTVEVEAGGSRYTLAKSSTARVLAGRGVPLHMEQGQVQLETTQSASVSFSGGELGLIKGAASVQSKGGSLRVGVANGTGGARLGDLVRAELRGPAELTVQQDSTQLALSVPKGARAVPLVLGSLNLALAGSERVTFSGTRQLEVTTLNPQEPKGATRIEISGGVRVRIGPSTQPDPKAEPGEAPTTPAQTLQLLEDSREFALGPGTYRFYRRGNQILVDLPKALRKADTPKPLEPQVDPGVVVKRPNSALPLNAKRYTLSNGAIVITRRWGPLVVRPAKRLASGVVVVSVAGPKGDIALEPKTQITLSRLARASRVGLPDGRFLLHENGASVGFQATVRQNGLLKVTISTGQRSVEIERGVEFDLAVRKDDYVLTYVFGQAVYLEPRRHMQVTQREGLRLRFVREKVR